MLGNIFASWEANFVSATMFPEVGKHGNSGRKHVFATMFPSLPRALALQFLHTGRSDVGAMLENQITRADEDTS